MINVRVSMKINIRVEKNFFYRMYEEKECMIIKIVINICADKIYLSWIGLISITELAKISKNNMINEHKYSKILYNHLCIIFDAVF